MEGVVVVVAVVVVIEWQVYFLDHSCQELNQGLRYQGMAEQRCSSDHCLTMGCLEVVMMIPYLLPSLSLVLVVAPGGVPTEV
jgi:hypothetical protein